MQHRTVIHKLLAEDRRQATPDPSYTLSGAWLLESKRAMVYVWRRGDRVRYVGVGTKGLGRILTNHHRLTVGNVHLTDAIDIYRCVNAKHAIALEQALIQQLKPTLNGTSGAATDRDDPSAYAGMRVRIQELEGLNARYRAALLDIAFARGTDPVARARQAMGWGNDVPRLRLVVNAEGRPAETHLRDRRSDHSAGGLP